MFFFWFLSQTGRIVVGAFETHLSFTAAVLLAKDTGRALEVLVFFFFFFFPTVGKSELSGA